MKFQAAKIIVSSSKYATFGIKIQDEKCQESRLNDRVIVETRRFRSPESPIGAYATVCITFANSEPCLSKSKKDAHIWTDIRMLRTNVAYKREAKHSKDELMMIQKFHMNQIAKSMYSL